MINKGDLIAGRYRILDTLGEGGMANVYLAEDIFLHRQVALKSLRLDLTDNQQFRERFKRESVAMSKLSSPYIVNILDVGDDSFPYIAMEYVDGPSLRKYLYKHHPLALDEIVTLMGEILQGVAVAHDNGIIHRDLKSQNVLLTPNRHAKVADFGIALALGEQSITQSDMTIGSIHYMAPERVRGARATVRSDIYALGIILFEMLTGKLPFDSDNSMAIAMQHFNDELPHLQTFNNQIPQALENVVLKATAKDPEQRYLSVREMAQDLKTSLDDSRQNEERLNLAPEIDDEETKVLTSLNDELPPTKETPKSKKHHLGWLWLLLLIVLVGIGFWLYPKREVTVPDVSDLSTEQATTLLRNSGLEVEKVVSLHDSEMRKGRIIRSLPPQGSHLKKGTKIKLVKSLGPRLSDLPDVRGLNYYDAQTKLKDAGFKVKKKSQYSTTVPAGLVIKQTPDAKKTEKLARNKLVTLTISLGQKNYGFEVKDLTGYNLRGVQDYANEEGLHLIIRYVNSNSVDKGLVVSQTPTPGTRVLRGDDLIITLSNGGRPNNENNDRNVENNNNDNVQNITRTVTIPYSSNNNGNNQVKIYIKDANHNLNSVYQSLTISEDTPVTINLQLNHGQVGQYVIERDGQPIESQTVTAN